MEYKAEFNNAVEIGNILNENDNIIHENAVIHFNHNILHFCSIFLYKAGLAKVF